MIFQNPFSTAIQTATFQAMQGLSVPPFRFMPQWPACAMRFINSQSFYWDKLFFFYTDRRNHAFFAHPGHAFRPH